MVYKIALEICATQEFVTRRKCYSLFSRSIVLINLRIDSSQAWLRTFISIATKRMKGVLLVKRRPTLPLFYEIHIIQYAGAIKKLKVQHDDIETFFVVRLRSQSLLIVFSFKFRMWPTYLFSQWVRSILHFKLNGILTYWEITSTVRITAANEVAFNLECSTRVLYTKPQQLHSKYKLEGKK